LADHRRGAAPIFNWGSLVRLLSWPAQTITAQQGRLQRRSLFLDLGRIQQRDQENGLKPPLWPPWAQLKLALAKSAVLTRWRSPCKQN